MEEGRMRSEHLRKSFWKKAKADEVSEWGWSGEGRLEGKRTAGTVRKSGPSTVESSDVEDLQPSSKK
jgi:hypothetical protein